MRTFLKQLFCKHNLEAYQRAEPITFLGIALWGRWDCYCTKCGKEKYGVLHSDCSTHEIHVKEMAILEAQLKAQEELFKRRKKAGDDFMRKIMGGTEL